METILSKCKYAVDCIHNRKKGENYYCVLLKDTSFKNGCPFYGSKRVYKWSNLFKEWQTKEFYYDTKKDEWTRGDSESNADD